MNNNRGSILVTTLGFALVFTFFGFSSIYVGTVQNELAEKRRSSQEAFWMADGAVQKAKSQLPGLSVPHNENNTLLGNGSYDLAVVLVSPSRWKATSKGVIGDQSRSIEAEIGRYNIENAITTEGTLNDDCLPDGSAQISGICAQGAEFSFESIFNGLSKNDIKNLPGTTQYDNINGNGVTDIPANGDLPQVTGVTYVTYAGNNNDSLHVPENSSDSGFLIIDASQSTGSITFNVTGGTFHGIIWVMGDVSVTGNPSISGAMFIENSNDTKIGGTANISFDASDVASAIEELGTSFTNKKPDIVSWKEI